MVYKKVSYRVEYTLQTFGVSPSSLIVIDMANIDKFYETTKFILLNLTSIHFNKINLDLDGYCHIFATSNKQHMNLLLANRLANQLMTEHGLIQQGWRFKFDNAKRRFGVCKYGSKIIGLSAPLVELNDEFNVRDTILHEIAHALVGPSHGHDHVWAAKAREIGCTGERCYDAKTVAQPESRYIAVCSECKHVFKRHKKPKLGCSQSCGFCSGGRFNPSYKLTWVLNLNF